MPTENYATIYDFIWATAKDRETDENGIEYFAVERAIKGFGTYFCGYCVFPVKPVEEPYYDGIVAKVDVHGGVTLAELMPDGKMVYGFDCAHYGDESRAHTQDAHWIIEESKRMASRIKVGAKYESDYLNANTQERKEKVIESYYLECDTI